MSSVHSVLLAGRYRLEDRIAVGGYGEVWRGTDVVLSRRVAVKLLQAGYTQHPEALARFRAEARHAGALSHPNIARVYDYGEPDPPHPPFLVMEFVDGPSLAGVLASGGPLGSARAMDIVAAAADGLDAAHQAGLVHRDIKPANLLLSGDGLVKITDFGISHAVGSAPVTGTGVLVGTPAYFAPERVDGSPATPASDLYSLGIVAYECLAGAMPFTGSPLEVALAHRMRSLPPLPASVPEGVAGLVGELTAKDPAARPASAGAVARRAAQLRDQFIIIPNGPGPTTPRPPDISVPAQLAPPTLHLAAQPRLPRGRKPPRLVTLAVVALLAVAVVVGLALAGSSGSSGSGGQPLSAPSSPSTPKTGAAVLTVEVNGSSLVGQPVAAVVRKLRLLGLKVSVSWLRSNQEHPGTVLSVEPGGRLRVGSLVKVTGALEPRHEDNPGRGHGDGGGPGDGGPGGGHGNGNGNGHGNDGGNGNGNGQGSGGGNGGDSVAR